MNQTNLNLVMHSTCTTIMNLPMHIHQEKYIAAKNDSLPNYP